MPPRLVLSLDKIHRSDAIVQQIGSRAAALEVVHPLVRSCSVHVAAEHWNPRYGHRFRTRVELELESETLIVGADSVEERVHAELPASIDAAFDTAEQVLREWLARRRGDAAPKEGPPRWGIVTRIFHFEGFGMLQGDDGAALPFHRNAVLRGAFENLEVGAPVQYVEGGDRERRATRVESRPRKT